LDKVIKRAAVDGNPQKKAGGTAACPVHQYASQLLVP
jgi:hypothetical protein